MKLQTLSTGSLGGGVETVQVAWFQKTFQKLTFVPYCSFQNSSVIMFKGNVFSLGTKGVCREFLDTCIN